MIYLLTIWFSFSVAVGDTIPTPPPPEAPADTVLVPIELDEEEVEEEEEIIEVAIWEYEHSPGFSVGETDSTMRWVNVLNLADRFSRKKGGITYRTGTIGRMDAVNQHAFESRHFRTEVNGLQINDPLTGTVNWNRIPTHKISSLLESDYGTHHRSQIRLRDHYLTEPRTYLNFDESSYNYRSLEFAATHNLSERTNIELSFWDRRDDIGYDQSGVEGSQVVFKGYRQLTDRWLLKAGYINNSMDQDQSFGYIVDDPNFFAFNPFVAQPVQGGANSEENSKDIYLQTHYRQSVDDPVTTELGLHYQSAERKIEFPADTLGTDFRNIELYGRQNIQAGAFQAQATGRVFSLDNRVEEQLTENFWLGGKGQITTDYRPISGITLSTEVGGVYRSDDQSGWDFSGRLDFQPFRSLTLSGFGGVSSSVPDIQSLYWQSEGFLGDENLSNEYSATAGVETVVGLGRYFSVGARGDVRDIKNGIFLQANEEVESQFVNIEPYQILSGMGWIGLDSSLFEGEISATYKSFETTATENSINLGLAETGDHMLFKGSLYWKNYLFDRATFVKAGLVGTFSPNAVRTAEYIAPLNRWQHGTNQFVNPSYSRVDVDVSARIRWMMLLLRMENVFDRVTQAGYFESVGYPMPERRFIFGLRILFTN